MEESQHEKYKEVIRKIQVSGKVFFAEYKKYLSQKTEDEISSIYIELMIKRNRIEKFNNIIGFSFALSIIVATFTWWMKIINASSDLAVVIGIGVNDIITSMTLMAILVIVLFLVIFRLLLGIESNCRRKIFIIEELRKK